MKKYIYIHIYTLHSWSCLDNLPFITMIKFIAINNVIVSKGYNTIYIYKKAISLKSNHFRKLFFSNFGHLNVNIINRNYVFSSVINP